MHEQATENSEKTTDGLAKIRAYRLANQNEVDAMTKRWRMVRKIVLIFLLCAFLMYGAKFLQLAWRHVYDYDLLNSTTAQVSQLVDNIRQFYILNDKKNEITMSTLIAAGAVPTTMLKNGKLVNPYAGNINFAISSPIQTNKGYVALDTFKISLQGLPYQACVDLAQIQCGTTTQGLYAIAVGSVDELENDTAFNDVDELDAVDEVIQVQDKNGQWQQLASPPRYKTNVVRAMNTNMVPLLSENAAAFGCTCGDEKKCSLALRYAF